MGGGRLIGRSYISWWICQKMLASANAGVYFGTLGMSARTTSILMRRPKRTVRRCGATLIELLVVITLIGLLMSSLLPLVGRSMRVASDTICKHRLREIGHTFALYEMDNAGWLPTMGASAP